MVRIVKLRIAAISILVVCSVALLFKVREILAPFIIAPILTYLLAPWVDLWSKKLKRPGAVITVYLTLFLVIALSGYLVIPQFANEIRNIAQDAPRYFQEMREEKLPRLFNDWEARAATMGVQLHIAKLIEDSLTALMKAGEGIAAGLPEKIAEFLSALVKTVMQTLLVFLLTAFLLIDLPRIRGWLHSLVPEEHRESTLELLAAMNKDLSGVIRGQLLICLTNGVLTAFFLFILQIKYSLTIGIIAGVFSLIPVLGSILSSIPAVLMGLTQSWLVALIVLLVIIGIHLLESNVLNPKIMGDSTELHPYVIMFALLAGERLFGVWGLLLGVPAAAIIRTIIRFIRRALFGVPFPREETSSPERKPPMKMEEPCA